MNEPNDVDLARAERFASAKKAMTIASHAVLNRAPNAAQLCELALAKLRRAMAKDNSSGPEARL
jgi:hypothetical protein